MPSPDAAAQGIPIRRCIALTATAVEVAGDREKGGTSSFPHSNTRLTRSSLLTVLGSRI